MHPANADFYRTIVCIVPLEGTASGNIVRNAARWAENGGKLVKTKLDLALDKLVSLVPRALEFTQDEEMAVWRGKVQRIQNIPGLIIERDSEGTLFRDQVNTWIYSFDVVAPVATNAQ